MSVIQMKTIAAMTTYGIYRSAAIPLHCGINVKDSFFEDTQWS